MGPPGPPTKRKQALMAQSQATGRCISQKCRAVEIVCFRAGFRARKSTLCGSVYENYHKKERKSIICCTATIKSPRSQARSAGGISPAFRPRHLSSVSRDEPSGRNPPQSPCPGSEEKYFSYFSSTPSISLASGSGSRLTVMFGHCVENSAFSFNHISRPGSVSGLIAPAGHSGSHTPQSMHSSGWMTRKFSPHRNNPPGRLQRSPCTCSECSYRSRHTS